jgi:plasmanylethanolamine desaturase
LYVATFLAVLMAMVGFTNEVHKRAHTDRVPLILRGLQKSRLILSPLDHAHHHTAPFDSYYCISSGVLNKSLTRLGFWPALLRIWRRVPQDHVAL